MIQSKKINIIVVVAILFALIISVAFVVIGNIQAEKGEIKIDTEYATEIFGTDIISIEIIADEADWQEMLDNAIEEQYIMVDVVVNGTKFQSVGIRPKGNSSLSQVASSNSDRYSFRIKFDEYIDGQTCFGLESLVVNNMLTDNTYMKEFVSYELMQKIGVDAPYFGFADIKVNNEGWGLYLAVETYGDSYESRIYGTTTGTMYNVKSAEISNANIVAEEQPIQPAKPNQPNNGNEVERAAENSMVRPSNISSTGGSLEYTNDEISSYSAIFSNVVGTGFDSDFERVIDALKELSTGENLESYFDVDQILRYLAAHSVVVNLDSYSSSMAQNYYIYENDGKVTILPWDYNQAWGGFQSQDASIVINFPIDSPVSGVEMSSRPLLEKLFSNTEYLEKYHVYLQELMTSYFADGKWEEKVEQLDALISDYVKSDNTAFCTFEEYKTAVEAFKTLGNLRYQSIQGQLDGTVPATTAEQTANMDQLISAGNLSLSSLGSMTHGGNRVDAGGRENNLNIPQGNKRLDMSQTENIPDRELMVQAMQILQNAGGIVTDEVKTKLSEFGLTEEQISMLSQMENEFSESPGVNIQNPTGNNTEITPEKGNITLPPGGQTTNDTSTTESLLIYSGLFALVLLFTFFVAKKKRNY